MGGITYLNEKRPKDQALDWEPDLLMVTRNGYIVTATGRGVDVLDSVGTLLFLVQTNDTVGRSLTLFEG